MTAPKANWFVDDLPALLDGDPFEAPVEEVGTPIDLAAPADLLEQLTAALHKEGQLEDAGAHCAIRAMRDSCCSACPVSQAEQKTLMGAFCRNGVEVERAVTAVIVRDIGAKAAR